MMKVEGMTDEELKQEIEFIMKVGAPMRQFLIDNISERFPDNAIRSRVLFNFMSNFICNTMQDVSDPKHMKDNIMEIIDNITAWANMTHEGIIANYDPVTKRIINKEEMH